MFPTSCRAAAVLIVGTAVLSTAPVAHAVTQPAAVAMPAAGPGVCPTNGILPLTSKLTNGQVKLGTSGSVSGSTGRACGVLTTDAAGNALVRIKPGNTMFAPVTTQVGLLSFPTTLKSASVLQGPTGFGPGGGLAATLGGKVIATADIMGQQCAIPLTIKLVTGRSGKLAGKEFVTDAKNVQHGRLVDGTFAVPAIQPSATCNVVVATLSNTLLGLPLAPGQSSITYDASIVLGQPGS